MGDIKQEEDGEGGTNMKGVKNNRKKKLTLTNIRFYEME
jgi:hypothetical protein